MVPKITGCCAFFPSKNQPATQAPGTTPTGVPPIPEIDADVIGCTGVAQGKSEVGKRLLSSV